VKETLNLLPAQLGKEVSEKKGKLYYLSIAIAGYIAIITMLWLFKIIEIKKIDNATNMLTAKKTELQHRLSQFASLPGIQSEDIEILNAIDKSLHWTQIISDLSVVTPEDVWLSEIESREDKEAKQLIIKGFATTQLSVANFISELEESKHFYNIEIVFSQKGEKSNISFELKAKLKWT
jgi:Tfp pilus assembly protein PilN